MVNQRAMRQYQQVDTRTAVEGASPHRLVQLLMEGVLRRLAEARGAMARGDIAARGERVGKAIAILNTLQASLNKEVNSELPEQLDALYDYMQRRLLAVSAQGDEAALEEVMELMRTVKEGWDGIAQQPTAAAGTPAA